MHIWEILAEFLAGSEIETWLKLVFRFTFFIQVEFSVDGKA
jgi:hypothetical protein